MLKYKNLFLRPGLAGVLGLYRREHLFPSGLPLKASCLPPYLNAFGQTSIKGLHSQVQTGRKGLAAEFEHMENNNTIEEVPTDSYLPSSYDAAMEALSSLISGKKRGDGSAVSDKYSKLERMSMYVKILGLEEHIAGLKIIHVAGTKGKGSTCAFCEAILRECGFRTGLFTSPHLIDVRERFRLDGLDISEEKFLHYFWECWHQLKENITDDLPMPPLFQFLTVMAFKIFASEKVDVAIIEVGLGGTRDSTNVIKNPVVCGVSPLGMDHMETLDGTIENSTSGDLVFYLDGAHSPESMEACAGWFSSAVKENQNHLSAHLNNVSSNGHLRPGKNDSVKISKNILLFNCMDVRDPQILLPTLVDRCALSGTYFAKAIFVPSISTYSKVTSGSSAVPMEIPSKDLTWQFNLQRVWEKIIHGKVSKSFEMKRPDTTPPRSFILDDDISNCSPLEGNYTCSAVVSSLPMTINWLRNYAKENPAYRIQVLVTGSLHLVGDVLKLLRR
ncbi:Folylpolyglutamate synthase [Striga hermonthica]|uniref:Folylpolyglutamate synthase n=1 Tax=Striga hermonthica TaxID=68872 RepID=A0A9N7MQA2_STRHE|nr:Folylpolyglutamate synthase [Striga hermonthica]